MMYSTTVQNLRMIILFIAMWPLQGCHLGGANTKPTRCIICLAFQHCDLTSLFCIKSINFFLQHFENTKSVENIWESNKYSLLAANPNKNASHICNIGYGNVCSTPTKHAGSQHLALVFARKHTQVCSTTGKHVQHKKDCKMIDIF
jgi:hypothetical protein